MQSFVRTVTDENYEKFIEEKPQQKKVLLFTERKTTAPLFKSLSKTFKDKLVFGEVKKQPELLKKFKVTKTPAVMVLTDPHGFEGELYDVASDFKIDQVERFLSSHAYS